MSKPSDGWVETGVRFLTIEEAEAYMFGTAPTHPIYPGDPKHEDATYEIGLAIYQDSFKRAVPTQYEPDKNTLKT